MKTQLKVMVSSLTNPWFNLATEDWIFKDMDPSVKILFLWRNAETVVIGRYQNPWTECNVQKMQEDMIFLARRQSGGGADFHDLGNTNFTFLNSKQDYSKETNNKIIITALKNLGIEAVASGRNDIVVTHPIEGDTRKISGSAFKETKDRAFHHGTLLINTDLKKLSQYLNPNQKKLESKGIKSVRARVANLAEFKSELHHDMVCEKIIESFFDHYQGQCPIEILDEAKLQGIPSLNEYFERLKDWNWRFGETPQFTHQLSERFEWGGVDVHIDSHKGIINEIKIYSDSLHPEMIEALTLNLKNREYSAKGVFDAIEVTKLELPMIGDYLNEFKDWLIASIT